MIGAPGYEFNLFESTQIKKYYLIMHNISQTHSAAHLNVNQRRKPKILEICNYCFVVFSTDLVFICCKTSFKAIFNNLVKWT